MRYLHRTIENRFSELFEIFPIVALTGSRQSGKTTLLKKHIDTSWNYFSFDDRELLSRVERDPNLFIQSLKSHIVLDEAQKAPSLFHSIKKLVDEGYPYKIIISGSANFLLMKSITESLAGRVGLLEMFPFSLAESKSLPSNKLITDIIKAENIHTLYESCTERLGSAVKEEDILKFILYGGYPKVQSLANIKKSWLWFSNYITTYVERDVRDLTQVGNLNDFKDIYKLFSFQTGQIMNMSNIGGDLGITTPTVKRYISILSTSYQIKILNSYHLNQKKQIIKSPKIFNLDTGISNYFLKNDTIDKMRLSGQWGSLLETWVYSEILKEINVMDSKPEIFYWRTNNGAEVDFILEYGETLFPIEVKSAVNIHPYDLRGIKSFVSSQTNKKIPFSIVLYRGQEVCYLEKTILALPITLLN